MSESNDEATVARASHETPGSAQSGQEDGEVVIHDDRPQDRHISDPRNADRDGHSNTEGGGLSDYRIPKRKRGRKRSRHEISSDSDSDDESSSDSDNSSSGHSSDGPGSSRTWSSNEDNDVISRNHEGENVGHANHTEDGASMPDHDGAADYTRYDPLKKKNKGFELSDDLMEYVEKHFNTFYSSQVLKDTVLKKSPVPEGTVFKVPERDEYLQNLIESRGKSYEKGPDLGLEISQQRILYTMGPLSRLWMMLEDVRKGKSESSLNLRRCLKLMEQAVLLIGQTHASINFQRRMNFLCKITKGSHRAKNLLIKYEDILKKSKGKLFGRAFHKIMEKKGKNIRSADDVVSGIEPDHKRKSGGHVKKRQKVADPSFSSRSGFYGNSGRGDRGPFLPRPSNRQSTSGGQQRVSFYQKPRGRGGAVAGQRQGRGTSSGFRHRYVHFYFDYSERAGGRVRKSGKHKQRKTPISSHKREKCQSSVVRDRSGYHSWVRKSPNSGKGEIFSGKLAKDHQRSRSIEHGAGLENRLSENTSTAGTPIFPEILQEGDDCFRQRGARDAQEGGGDFLQIRRESICEPFIHSAQEGWGEEAHHQPEGLQPIYSVQPFQDGRSLYGKGYHETRGLSVQDRFERCVFLTPHQCFRSEILEVSVAGKTLAVHLPGIWFSLRAPLLHKVVETSSRVSEANWYASDYLFRRRTFAECMQTGLGSGQRHSPFSFPVSGPHDKLGEVSFGTSSGFGVLGSQVRFSSNDDLSTRGQDSGPEAPMPRVSSEGLSLGTRFSTDYRKNDIDCTGNHASSPSVQVLTNDSVKGSDSAQELRGNYSSPTPGEGGTLSVDNTIRNPQWQEDNYTLSRPVYRVRCLQRGMGGSMSGHQDRGSMECAREEPEYQCPRTTGSFLCTEIVHQGPEMLISPYEIGQRGSGNIYKQNGGNEVSRTESHHETDVGFLCGQGHSVDFRTFAVETQSRSGLGKPEFPGFKRLDAESNSFSGNQEINGSVRTGSFCQITRQTNM